MSRDPAIARFLQAAGWSEARAVPLAGDASNRRYVRLSLGAERAVLMDAPPERGEDVRPFVAMTRHLRARGLSAPEILAADAETGLLLLEDLGDDLFAHAIAAGRAAEAPLYDAAIDLLADLHRSPADPGLAPYDAAIYRREAALVTDWYLPQATGAAVPEAVRADGLARIEAACAAHATGPAVTTLRDYHAENLIWLPGRQGTARVGLLDYQDALAGHPAYDFVSLLEDARRDTSDALRARALERYLAATGRDPGAFGAACAALGAQRNLKIIGIFARLCLRDGKPAYLDLMPRVWGHLQRDLSHPALGHVADWAARHLPAPDVRVRDRLRAARAA